MARFGEFGIEALTDTRWRRAPTFDVPLKGPGHGARVPLAARTDELDRTPRGATAQRTHASALRAFFGAWTGTARARRVGDHRSARPPSDRSRVQPLRARSTLRRTRVRRTFSNAEGFTMSVASVLTRNDGNAPPANGRVRQWLSRAGLGEYRDAFARTAEREFTALGMVDFQNFGVVDVAHKQTLFRLIKNLQNAESDLQNAFRATTRSFRRGVKHMALVDVHAAEHDELLLSPCCGRTRARRGESEHEFAPSPADDKGGERDEARNDASGSDDTKRTDRTDAPLEQLRRLSRERHVRAVGQAAANAGETTNDAASRSSRNESVSEDANKNASSPPDPAKTPFVASPSGFEFGKGAPKPGSRRREPAFAARAVRIPASHPRGGAQAPVQRQKQRARGG